MKQLTLIKVAGVVVSLAAAGTAFANPITANSSSDNSTGGYTYSDSASTVDTGQVRIEHRTGSVDANDNLEYAREGYIRTSASGIDLNYTTRGENGTVESSTQLTVNNDGVTINGEEVATKEDVANKTSLESSTEFGTQSWGSSVETSTYNGATISYNQGWTGGSKSSTVEVKDNEASITVEENGVGTDLKVTTNGVTINGDEVLTTSALGSYDEAFVGIRNANGSGSFTGVASDINENISRLNNHENRISTLESASGSTYDDTPLTDRITTLEAAVNAPKTTLYTGANSPQDAYVDAYTGWSGSDGQNAGRVVIEASGDGYGDSAAIIVKGLENGNTSIDLYADTVSVNGDEVAVKSDLLTEEDLADAKVAGVNLHETVDGYHGSNALSASLNAEATASNGETETNVSYTKISRDIRHEASQVKVNANGCLLYTSPSPRDS